MKTISLKLSVLINEKWVLDNIETEYYFRPNWDIDYLVNWYDIKTDHPNYKIMKTLTLEEAIDLLPEEVWYLKYRLHITKHMKINKYILWKYQVKYYYWIDRTLKRVFWNTLLEAIESMILFLLNKNLLWENTNN